MASSADVERSIRTLAKKLAAASVDPGQIPDRVIVCVIPDLAAAFRAQLKNSQLGAITLVDPSEAADVRITASGDDLIALIEGRLNVGMAFLMGRVRVDASTKDMMLLRRLF